MALSQLFVRSDDEFRLSPDSGKVFTFILSESVVSPNRDRNFSCELTSGVNYKDININVGLISWKRTTTFINHVLG